jgi:hypothetical protein
MTVGGYAGGGIGDRTGLGDGMDDSKGLTGGDPIQPA